MLTLSLSGYRLGKELLPQALLLDEDFILTYTSSFEGNNMALFVMRLLFE